MNWRAWLHPNKLKETVRKPRVRKIGLGILAAWLVIVAALFFGGPPLIKSYLVNNVAQQLGRKVSVGAVHVNPFMLSVTIDDFTLDEADGKTPFVAFKQLYLNVQLASIVARGPILSEIRLADPRVHLVRAADDRYNFQDIVERLAKSAPKQQKAGAKPMNFSLNNIRIVDGQIDFDDRAKKTKHEIRDLNVAIPFLSNLFYRVDDYVQPSFSAVVNGAPFHLTGESKPFEANRESSLDLKLSQVDLTDYVAYLPQAWRFTLASGTLGANIKLSFLQPPQQAPKLRLSGSIGLQDLALNEAKAVPVLRLKRLDVALGDLEPLMQRYTVDRVAATGAELFARRDREGRINLTQLFAPSAAGSKAPLPYFLVHEITLNQSTIHVHDEDRPQPFDTSVGDISLTIRNLTSAKDAKGSAQLSATGPGGATLKASTDIALTPPALSGLNLQLAGVKVTQPGAKTAAIRIGQFAISGGALDLAGRRVGATEISLSDSQFSVERDRKGHLNLIELAGGTSHAAAAPPAAASAPAWQYAVKRVSVNDVGVGWRDEVPVDGPAVIGVDKINASLEGVSSAPDSAAKLALKAKVGRSGSIGIDGSVSPASLSAKLKIDARGLPIVPVQPYFSDKVHVLVTGGTLNSRSSVDAVFGQQVKIRYRGNVQINRFASVDRVNHNDFLKWQTLHIGGVSVATAPLKIAVNDISLSNFYSRLIVNPDGTLNVQHVMGSEAGAREATAGEVAPPAAAGNGRAPAKKEGAAATSTHPPEAAKPPAPVKIGLITLQGGRVNFSDHYIKPNYSANLTKIDGRVSGLSSNLSTTADVELRGMVGDTAPVDIHGKVNPLSGNLYLDLTASAKSIDLPAATPYATRYVGYPIVKGKLTMDVKYHIENHQLTAQNRLILDQLTFGNKVNSPTATKLPVLLAVALLKNSNGVIDINLPISGSLNDPQFSMGGIIAKVIVNLVVKAVTSPFALLGKLFGGGEELAYINFQPGHAALNQTAQNKLKSLTKALLDRPGLKLDITGRADPQTDIEGLRQAALEHQVKAVKFDILRREGKAPSSLDEVKVEPAEYPKLLKQAYSRAKFPKPRNFLGFAKSLPVPDMQKLILANVKVTDDDLRQLALRRARTVADAIVKSGVAAARVFVLASKIKPESGEKAAGEKAAGSRVDFSLK